MRAFNTDKGDGGGPKSQNFSRHHMYMFPYNPTLLLKTETIATAQGDVRSFYLSVANNKVLVMLLMVNMLFDALPPFVRILGLS